MQAQSRLAVTGGGGNSGGVSFGALADKHEAVVRELTRGHELTARLQAEALRALRGQGQAEDTAAFILGEVSRAFNVCLAIMAGASPAARAPATSPRPETPDSNVSVGAPPPRAGEDNIPRKKTLTPSPFSDGYQWRKYGQKKINNTNFPRGYYRCSYHRERNCPAQKQVQQHNDDVPPVYAVVYTHEHTCQQAASASASELPDAANSGGAAPDSLEYCFPAGTTSLRAHNALADDRAAKDERERQLFVSSLACVLQGREWYDDDDDSCGVGEGAAHAHAPAPAAPKVAGSSSELPGLDAGEGLDVMDYDMTDALFFGPFGAGSDFSGTRDDGTLF